MSSICWVRVAARLGRTLDVVDQCLLLHVGSASPEQFGVADDQGKQVVEVVGHPAGDLTHGLQPLGLDQGPLGSPDLAQVHAGHQHGQFVVGRDGRHGSTRQRKVP